MSLLDALRRRLRPLVRRRDFDEEMAEEFRHHIELQAQEFPGRTDAAAGAHFGSQAYYMEETRRMTPLRWVDALGQDARYAWRNLRRTPGFTAIAVLSLAIGIGANSAIFGLIYSVLLQPLPVSHPEQLVEIQRTGVDVANDAFSYSQYQSLRRSRGFSDLTAIGGTGYVPIAAGSYRGSVSVDGVDGNFFTTIGLRPLRGRLVSVVDERARAPVVVISDALWSTLFDRSATAIGSTVSLRGVAFTVIGVAPQSYQGLSYPGSFETAVPLSTLALVGGDPVETTSANAPTVQIVGRLAHASNSTATGSMVKATWQSCCAGNERSSSTASSSGIRLVSIERGIAFSKFDVSAMFGRVLFDLMGGAVVVLLAACANIGTLLLARAAARERELAVRLSLGASRGRLAAQMLVESAILAAIGTAAGLAMAWWALRGIAHRMPGPIVDRVGLQLNGEVLGFTAMVGVVAVLLFGGIPAWRATRTSLIGPLRDGAQSSSSRRAGLLERGAVIAQVAVALVLVNAAGLFVATVRNLRTVNGGFATERTATIGLDARGTPYEATGVIPLADGLLRRAALVPGVRSVAMSASVPVTGGRGLRPAIAVEGYTPTPDENMRVWLNVVTPGFFATLGIALRAGRDFSPDDRGAGQTVVIVNEAFAHQYLRGRNPLGAIVRSVAGTDTLLMQVVGVVGDARYMDVRQPAPPMFYEPLAQIAQLPLLGRIPVLELTVRTTGDDGAVGRGLRSAVASEAPELQADDPQTIEASLDGALSRELLTAELVTLFGAVALVLAAIGLYGVVSYHVAHRTREIGVRMALGSAVSSVVWMVLKQALMLVTIGVLVGVPLAIGGGKAIAAELFGLAGQSTLFVVGAGVLLIGVAVLASALPARRAARVDPLIALRGD